MWKRLNRPTSPTAVQIGSPTLVETTLDEDSAAKLRDLYPKGRNTSNAPSAQTASRSQNNSESQGGGRHAIPQMNEAPRSSAARPVSSIYSQPSPTMQTHQKPKLDIPRASSIYPDDISPPDSPRGPEEGARSSSPNVSPITDAGSGHRLSASSSRPSNIPLPKQKAHGGTTAFISNWKEKIAAAQGSSTGKMKWDDYSGEPTSSEKGKAGQVVPGSTPFHKASMGTSTTITSQGPPNKSIFGTTLRKVPRKESSASPPPPPPKEAWKGASGRAPIIPVVQSKPDPHGTKKSFPTPSQRRQKQGIRQAMGLKSPEGRSSPADEVEKTSPKPAVKKTAPPVLTQVIEESDGNAFDGSDVETPRQEYTESPLNIPPRTDSMGVYDHSLGKGDPLPAFETIPEVQEPQPTVRKVATEPVAKKSLPPQVSPRTTSLPPTHDFSAELPPAVRNLNLNNEPASRFSATTYNTTIQDLPDTPKQSFEEPPLPIPGGDSMLNRKRPVPTAGGVVRSKPPSRKPTPSEVSSADTDTKSLPQQPAQETAVDRVILLEAKLNSLHKRKQNLQTVIHELTNVVQPSSAAYDKASRQEIKKTVDGLNIESAAVAKEIHETGLKLHRALKKRDESASYEPTGLWVRRVTG